MVATGAGMLAVISLRAGDRARWPTTLLFVPHTAVATNVSCERHATQRAAGAEEAHNRRPEQDEGLARCPSRTRLQRTQGPERWHGGT